jgi:hypothetical protein
MVLGYTKGFSYAPLLGRIAKTFLDGESVIMRENIKKVE